MCRTRARSWVFWALIVFISHSALHVDITVNGGKYEYIANSWLWIMLTCNTPGTLRVRSCGGAPHRNSLPRSLLRIILPIIQCQTYITAWWHTFHTMLKRGKRIAEVEEMLQSGGWRLDEGALLLTNLLKSTVAILWFTLGGQLAIASWPEREKPKKLTKKYQWIHSGLRGTHPPLEWTRRECKVSPTCSWSPFGLSFVKLGRRWWVLVVVWMLLL